MTLTQVWGALLIFIVCPLVGGLPLIDWITYAIKGQQLTKLGTGNISVSAAFYHGGTLVGILAVLSEAGKGIGAVLLARAFFPTDPTWELVALFALVVGRYWMAKGAGTTNVFWGIVVHDWQAALLTTLIGGVSFTIFRDRASGRLVILVLLGLLLPLWRIIKGEYVGGAYIGATIILVGLIAWILQKIPDDLDLPITGTKAGSQKMFHFFRGDGGILCLEEKLDRHKVGQKAANLAQLKRWGYSVPDGWVLLPGDDPKPLIEYLEPSPENPLAVRSSAIGEDSASASAAGQYATILNVTSREALQAAILDCLTSYDYPAAIQYRRDRHQPDRSMAVLIQKQVQGVISGVAFSRDPVNQLNQAVVIESLPGTASQVVSGQITPQRAQIQVDQLIVKEESQPQNSEFQLIPAVAQIAREIEHLYHGIPQDIEWTYDGQQLWILQTRAITTLQPIWTRKIAAEVIPGLIRPLTWSINRPLTCGVWGEIFTLVLGNKAQGLDFRETATLHFHRAYFNATLLGAIFRRMGLPPESLEFLTRGEKFSRPSLLSTFKNLPGLLRLLNREKNLAKDFDKDERRYFTPTLNQLVAQPPAQLPPEALLERIETILTVLKKGTYYSILAPLSLALRQAIFQVTPEQLDNRHTPEVESLRSLANLATDARKLLPMDQLNSRSCASLFAHLAEIPDGDSILAQFDQWLEKYGYLSEVATDIAVPRWQENPHPVRDLFTQYLFRERPEKATQQPSSEPQGWKIKNVQQRLNLKGKVTTVYSKLLAHLRWSFLALAEHWQTLGLLSSVEEIFFLEFAEIRRLISEDTPQLRAEIVQFVEQRKRQFEQSQEIKMVPSVVYGNPPISHLIPLDSSSSPRHKLQGIAASPGQIEGRVKVLHNLQQMTEIDPQTILVVPYTDSGWAPFLSQAGGLIAEVGGQLSHGAIVAREYGIPAVMDVHNATQILQDGQRVRIDGQEGVVDILD